MDIDNLIGKKALFKAIVKEEGTMDLNVSYPIAKVISDPNEITKYFEYYMPNKDERNKSALECEELEEKVCFIFMYIYILIEQAKIEQ